MIFEVDGASEAIANIDAILEAMRGAPAKAAFMRGAEILRDEAKSTVEVYSGPPEAGIIPGELRENIFAAPGPEDLPNAVFGVSLDLVPYAIDIEFGNTRQAAIPFLRTAAETAGDQAIAAVADGLLSMIEDSVK